MTRLAAIGLVCALAAAGPSLAADPADMAALAKREAASASARLSRFSLGRTAIPDYEQAKFRSVRAHYRRSEFFLDHVIFCGEIDMKLPDGSRTGWIGFGYWPGDPTTFFTAKEGVGMPQIGPQVYKAHCASGKEQWLEGDYTEDFHRLPDAAANQ